MVRECEAAALSEERGGGVRGERGSRTGEDAMSWFVFELVAYGMMFLVMFWLGFSQGLEFARRLQGGG